MITDKFSLNISKENVDKITWLQKLRSTAFRKIFNNIDKKENIYFQDEIVKKFIFSVHAYKYLVRDVETLIKINIENKQAVAELIEELNKKLNSTKNIKKKIKTQNKINLLLQSEKSKIVFGGKSLLKDIARQNTALNKINDHSSNEYINKSNILSNNKLKFKQNRILPLYFIGESFRKGNRFFNLSDIQNGNIIFKYEATDIKLDLKFNITNKKQKIKLSQLMQLAMDGIASITVKLTSEHIYFTYDECLLSKYYLNKRKMFNEIYKLTEDKDERKELIKEKLISHSNLMLKGKISNRHLSYDSNPDGIGYVILDYNVTPDGKPNTIKNIIVKDYIDFEKLNMNGVSSNKKKHELSVAINKLFELAHYYKVSGISIEDINIKSKDNGNKISNKKINNDWRRNWVNHMTRKRSNIDGIKLIEIDPPYSSIIGNIQHNEYDPVAAAIEIGRRGINKFKKGIAIYPPLTERDVTEASKIAGMDYIKFAGVKTWKDVSKVVLFAKKSVRRREINNFMHSAVNMNGTDKSRVRLVSFHKVHDLL